MARRPRHLRSHDHHDHHASSQRPWTKTTGGLPDALARATCSASKGVMVEAMAKAAFKKQWRNAEAVTEYAALPGKGHSLVLDSGWRDVADTALEFLGRVLPRPV